MITGVNGLPTECVRGQIDLCVIDLMGTVPNAPFLEIIRRAL
jgi:hypothetical protein